MRHNVPFVCDMLRNDDFARGHTPTGFVRTHYPDGFSGARLSERERRDLAAIAREVQRRRTERTDGPQTALSKGDGVNEDVVACLGGMFGNAYLVRSGGNLGDGIITCSVVRLAANGGDKAKEVILSALE